MAIWLFLSFSSSGIFLGLLLHELIEWRGFDGFCAGPLRFKAETRFFSLFREGLGIRSC
jgi:hypothetical protein